MTLAGWQAEVVELVSMGRRSPAATDPTRAEQRSIAEIEGSAGLAVTRAVGTAWRADRLRRAVPLTIGYLVSRGTAERILSAYHAATRAPSPHPIAEGLQFLDFVSQIAPPLPHLPELMALERAVLRAHSSAWRRQPAPAGTRVAPLVALNPDAALIRVEANPAELLLAAMTGEALPPPGTGQGEILVGPGIAGLMRLATRREAHLVSLIAARRSLVPAIASAADEDVLQGLLDAGVLVLDDGHRVAAGGTARRRDHQRC